ncbi:D-tyrosyl-tRNA(Tyr) deacylase [Ruminococcaceae bacterium OttesenSCG-928-I18]|nr:D-tyrosyl-tRNA(Tyr) deacylase [Ruminococcaceae bacterium OttesenSCG-928-I18]
MRAVVQRVKKAAVLLEAQPARKIGPGLLIFLGVREGDEVAKCKKMAEKCAHLRIFEDAEGKMNRSAVELGYEALVISNFTLYADTKKGKRPSFAAAAKPPLSVDCYEAFVGCMRQQGLAGIETGEFGAHMEVELVNDGPVTLILDTDEWEKK